MSIEETGLVWEKFKAADQAHDAEAMRNVYAEDVVLMGTPLKGRQALMEFDASFFAAFPDYQREYLQEVIGDGAVAFVWRMSATHTGHWMGLEPTGNRIEGEGCSVLTVRDAQAVEVRFFGPDYMAQLRRDQPPSIGD